MATSPLVINSFQSMFGLMLSMMDNYIVSASLYTIALEFGSLADAIWAVLAYTLSYLGTVSTLSDVVRSLTSSHKVCRNLCSAE